MVTKSKQKPNLASPDQALASAQTSWEVSLSWSPPRRLLSWLFAFVPSDRSPAPPGSAPAPPTADQRREGSASEAIGEPSQGPPGVQLPSDPPRLRPEASRGRCICGGCGTRRRGDEPLPFLASESPDSRLPHEHQRTASKSVLRLSEGLSRCRCPRKGV